MIIKNNLFLTADNCPKCNKLFNRILLNKFYCKDCKIKIMCGITSKYLSFTILNTNYVVCLNWNLTVDMNINYIGYYIEHNNVSTNTGIEFSSYKEIIDYIEKYASNIMFV